MKRHYQLHAIMWVIASFLICSLMVGTAEARREFVRFGGSNPGGSWFT
ncbi:MAG: hypothetical protein GTO13_15840, partial [Proteobacteria bacterium]|nr:hypothetical protein [Pseudomonadota bacterium]